MVSLVYGWFRVDDRDPQPQDDAHPDERTRGDPLGLISGGEGIFTGTVVCAAAIAYGAGHLDSTAQLSLAIFGTVLIYWLAHLHAPELRSKHRA